MVEAAGTFQTKLSGEYDISRTAELRDSILGLHDGEGAVVIDLSGVTFLDSSGLRALVEVRSVLDDQSVRLTVANPSECVRRLLEITGTAAMFGL
jgi:anti-sigma B factor antagonist